MLRSVAARLTLTLLIMTTAFSTPASALELVTSIKPLQLLVAAISDGVSQPHLLIPGTSSPHDFQLRPSERKQLEQAELIFWVGPDLELSLTKVLQQLPASVQVIALMDPPAATSPPEPARHEEHEKSAGHGTNEAHSKDEKHSKHDAHQHSRDPHIWLDPDRARQLAQQIAAALSQADQKHATDYQQNLIRFLNQLEATDQQLLAQLEPVQSRGYFVFHDGYQGFEQHYGLNQLGAFTLSPERRPGARHLARVRQQLVDEQAVCVFSEPQFSPALLANLIESTATRQGQLDPMGATIEVNAQGYLNLLRQLGQSFKSCLSD